MHERRLTLLTDLFNRLRPDPVRRRIEDSIRSGTGLSKQDWVLEQAVLETSHVERLTEEILEWCRERISETRRPYGIDQLALALACAVPGGDPLASTTFGVFRPVDFYGEDGVGDRIEHFVRSIRVEDLNRRIAEGASGIRFAAALFSWGDVAREAMFDED